MQTLQKHIDDLAKSASQLAAKELVGEDADLGARVEVAKSKVECVLAYAVTYKDNI